MHAASDGQQLLVREADLALVERAHVVERAGVQADVNALLREVHGRIVASS